MLLSKRASILDTHPVAPRVSRQLIAKAMIVAEEDDWVVSEISAVPSKFLKRIRSPLLPWLLTAISFGAFASTYSELVRWRAKFSYMDAWQYATNAAVTDDAVVVMGDSITAFAPLPDRVCGRPVIKAGVGGAGTNDFIGLSRVLLAMKRPSMIVVALGANDVRAAHADDDYGVLLSQLKAYTPNLIAVSDTGDENIVAQQKAVANAVGVLFHEVKVTGLMPDGVHFNQHGYRQWVPAM